jgi:hypothetical protein
MDKLVLGHMGYDDPDVKLGQVLSCTVAAVQATFTVVA